jgi:hypothetical protein
MWVDLHFVKKGVLSFLVLLLRIVVALLPKTKQRLYSIVVMLVQVLLESVLLELILS